MLAKPRPVGWSALEYEGPALPASYTPKGLVVKIAGQKVALSPLAEEMAAAFVKKVKYWQDETFVKNFLEDFARECPAAAGAPLIDLDFSEVSRAVESEKESRKLEPKESRKARAAAKEALKEVHGYATVNGSRTAVANWMVEPPGILIGRGGKPARGHWKRGVSLKDITLNCSSTSNPGLWKEVVQDKGSSWLARWDDQFLGKKYVWLHETSPVQQDRNKAKYDNSMRIGRHIGRVRIHIEKGMRARDKKLRQVATACYLIDAVGIRVGNEKGEDEAQTRGCTTLLVRDIKFDGGGLLLDFLGKDSIEYVRSIDRPDPQALENLKTFCGDKKPDDLVFDRISSDDVNRFLSGIVPGMSARSFRTYHATRIVKEYLASHTSKDPVENEYQAKMANLEAAMFLNHRRTLPPTWDEAMRKKREKLEVLKANPKTMPERVRAKDLEYKAAMQAKDYNLGTSMRNYVDPRIMKAWAESVGIGWAKLYSKSLQRKFAWTNRSKVTWESLAEV